MSYLGDVFVPRLLGKSFCKHNKTFSTQKNELHFERPPTSSAVIGTAWFNEQPILSTYGNVTASSVKTQESNVKKMKYVFYQM
jgi:hypothetical protein